MKTNVYTMIAGIVVMAVLVSTVSCNKPAGNADGPEAPKGPNTLSEAEEADGWELLFDGATLEGWKRFNHDTIGPLWSVQDGAIVCDGKGLTEGTEGIGGSLVTTREFGNFELVADWKVSPGGNSGILYHVVEKPEYHCGYTRRSCVANPSGTRARHSLSSTS